MLLVMCVTSGFQRLRLFRELIDLGAWHGRNHYRHLSNFSLRFSVSPPRTAAWIDRQWPTLAYLLMASMGSSVDRETSSVESEPDVGSAIWGLVQGLLDKRVHPVDRTPSQRVFLAYMHTFILVHTSHCGSSSRCCTTCLHKTCSSTCRHMSERLLFPCFVFFLCLSCPYVLSHFHLFSVLNFNSHDVQNAEH